MPFMNWFTNLSGRCLAILRQHRSQTRRLKSPTLVQIESFEGRILLSAVISSVTPETPMAINDAQSFTITGTASATERPDPSSAPNIRFTLPLATDSPAHFYFDRNPTTGAVLSWNGGSDSYDGHRGTDFSGLPRNTSVYAAASGTLMEREDDLPVGSLNETTKPNGNYVRINHGNDRTGTPIISVYLHLNAGSVTLKPIGAWIEVGERIGGIGTSGQSEGPHLHFETQRGLPPNRVAFDPYAASGETSWWSSAPKLGVEFRVNTTTDGGFEGFLHGGLAPVSGSQFAVQLASDANGNFVAVLQGPNRDGHGTFDVFLQRFDANGRPVGSEVPVNFDWHGQQTNPEVAVAPDGRIIVVYEHTDDDQASAQFNSLTSIYAQWLNLDGTPIGDPIQVASTPARRWAPDVGVAQNGSFVVTWTSQSSDGLLAGMSARRFDSSGTALGDEFTVNTTPLNSQVLQVSNSMAMNDAGAFVVVWSNFGPDGSDQGVFGQRFNAFGERVGGEFRVNTTTFDSQLTPRVAMDHMGRFMVTWDSRLQDGSGWGAYAQGFNADGTRAGSEFLVTNTTQGSQGPRDIAVNADGQYIITWDSDPSDDGIERDVYIRQFAADGTPLGDEIRANETTASTQWLPAVVFGKAGRYFVAWASLDQDGAGYGVYGRVAGVNEGIQGEVVVQEGKSVSITSTELPTPSIRGSATSIVYKLATVPSHGQLRLNSTTLRVGRTFTQADVNAGRLSYRHDGSETTKVTFAYIVAGLNRQALSRQTFSIVVTPVNDPPILSGVSATTNYREDAAPLLFARSARIADPDTSNFASGQLTVSITANAKSTDRLTIQSSGTRNGQVSIESAVIRFTSSGETRNIGTLSGGEGLEPLTVTFNALTTGEAVQAVLRQVAFQNTSDDPSPLARTVTITLTDGDGGTSNITHTQVRVTPTPPSNVATLGIPTNFNSAAYRSENIFWWTGNAPNSVSPPNPQLGAAKGNCTWFAYGRLRELGYSTNDLNKLSRDAGLWDDLAVSAHIPVDKTPAVGAIAQFKEMNHVAVVEKINSDGTIVISESSYAPGSKSWDFLYRTRTIAPSAVDNFIHVRR